VSEFIETIVVGGGQAGLAISYYLKQEGREHLVLERAPAIANAWRNQRWDSFTLVTPNFQVRMPASRIRRKRSLRFMSLREVVKYFDDYVQRYRLPVPLRCRSAGRREARIVFPKFEQPIATTKRRNVVIATGLYQSAKIPAFAAAIPRTFFSCIPCNYRNPLFCPKVRF